jgi:glutaredoxin
MELAMKAAKLLLQVAIVALCFGVGVFGTPLIRAAYAKVFPAPEFVVGNYQEIQQNAGSKVVVFATKTCPFCEKTRELLREKNVAYVEYLLDGNDAHQSLFQRYDGEGVPLLFIGDRRIEGFRESTITDALNQLRP